MKLNLRNFHSLSRLQAGLVVIVIIALLFIPFKYYNLLNSPPQSTHLWRQSDCASLALNYYQDGMQFFKPEIHNQHADGGTTGYATSENPYLYYIVASLYKVFGHNYWVFRGLWMVIFVFGLLAGFKIFYWHTKSFVISIAGGLIVLLTPVVVYYGNNFLPDAPALMFVFIGWLFFFKWMQKDNYYLLFLTALFFMLGALLKVTALISFFSLAGVWMLEFVGFKLRGSGQRVFVNKWKSLLPFAITFISILLWYVWAWNYNSIHSTKYFSMRTCPVWNISSCANCSFSELLSQIRIFWLPHLLGKHMQIFYIIVIGGLVFYAKKLNPLLVTLSVFTFLGSISYMAIWFAAFQDHDYYFVNLFIFPFFLVLTLFEVVTRELKTFKIFNFLVVLFVSFFLYQAYYTSIKQRDRYRGWMNEEHFNFSDIRVVAPLIDELGIEKNDRIVSIPDRTPNYTLYLLNRKGWTLLYNQSTDSASLKSCIDRGGKFLFVSNFPEQIEKRPYLKSFTSELIGVVNNLRIFRIDGMLHKKMLINTKDTIMSIRCGAESIAYPGTDLMESNLNQFIFKGGNAISDEKSLTEAKSLFIGPSHPFGFTVRVPAILQSNLSVSAWKYPPEAPGMVAISAKNANELFVTSDEGAVDFKTGWKRIERNLQIDNSFKFDSLVLFVWNNKDEYAYIDDFEVLFYRNKLKVIEKEIK